ncbi:2601_t:CDS:1, partial [Funneliformis mosseae]
EELEKCLVYYRKTDEDYKVTKKVYNKVKDQLPKEVFKNAI